MKKFTVVFLAVTFFLLLQAGLIWAQDFPKPSGYVNDFARIIPQDY